MKTPLRLEVEGCRMTRRATELVRDQFRKLEARFADIVACRVVIRAPGRHHRQGDGFGVTIHLTLPGGREINVGRNSADRRCSDLGFALRDAFRQAVGQLQRQVERLRAQGPQLRPRQ